MLYVPTSGITTSSLVYFGYFGCSKCSISTPCRKCGGKTRHSSQLVKKSRNLNGTITIHLDSSSTRMAQLSLAQLVDLYEQPKPVLSSCKKREIDRPRWMDGKGRRRTSVVFLFFSRSCSIQYYRVAQKNCAKIYISTIFLAMSSNTLVYLEVFCTACQVPLSTYGYRIINLVNYY